MLLKIKKLFRRVHVHILLGRRRTMMGMQPRIPAACGGSPVMALGRSLAEAHDALLANWGSLFIGFTPASRVLVKINLNTANPYPASTDPAAALMLVELLRSQGVADVTVGDCSCNSALPTRKVFRQSGMAKALRGRASYLAFEDGDWADVPVDGQFMKNVTLTQAIYKYDKIIHLANLKTHMHAGYSAGIKLAMGYVHPRMRSAMHQSNLCEKLAELALAVQPDVTIVDGRTAFVSGGPDVGTIANGGMLLAGCDQLAVDTEAYRLLCRLKTESGQMDGFPEEPAQSTQISHYRKLKEEGRLR